MRDTPDVVPQAITGSVYTSMTGHTTVTTSGTVATVNGISLPPNFFYARIEINSTICSARSSALGWALDLSVAGGTKLFGWDYMAFASGEVNQSNIFKPFSFSYIDTSGSTEYYAVMGMNSGQTEKLIPVYMPVEIAIKKFGDDLFPPTGVINWPRCPSKSELQL
jgi:hypothetical protein